MKRGDAQLEDLNRGLAGHLLCAVPQLEDPNFRRAVVLVIEHQVDGTLGLVLNQELGVTVASVADQLGVIWEGDPEQKVRMGGPVQSSQGWILHGNAAWDPHATPLGEGLWLTSSLDHIEEHNQRIGGADFSAQLILGYAGWDGGQLESELAGGSWVAVPVLGMAQGDQERGVSISWLKRVLPMDMWNCALSSIGIDPFHLVGQHASGPWLQ